MNNIPTALDLYRSHVENPKKGWSIEMAMKEFAKLHVEAALKAAAEGAIIDVEYIAWATGRHSINKQSILSAYPLDLIK